MCECPDFITSLVHFLFRFRHQANGVGTILAERNFLDEAKEIFVQLREAASATDLPDVWLNMAHVLLAQGQRGEGRHHEV